MISVEPLPMRKPRGFRGVLDVLSILKLMQDEKPPGKDKLGQVLETALTRAVSEEYTLRNPFGRRMDPLQESNWSSILRLLGQHGGRRVERGHTPESPFGRRIHPLSEEQDIDWSSVMQMLLGL